MQTLTHTHGKMLRESSQTVQDETADSVSICEPDQSLNHLTLAFGFGFPNSCQYTRGPNIAIGMFVLSYSPKLPSTLHKSALAEIDSEAHRRLRKNTESHLIRAGSWFGYRCILMTRCRERAVKQSITSYLRRSRQRAPPATSAAARRFGRRPPS